MSLHSFTYRDTPSYWIFFPALVFGGISFYCFFFQARIAYRRFELLSYPSSYLVTGGIGLAFLVYAWYSHKAAKDSLKNKAPISLYEANLSFPQGAEGTVSVQYKDVYELWNKHDDSEGDSVILYVNNARGKQDRYEFFSDNFNSAQEFQTFSAFLMEHCTEITNKK